MSDGDPSTIFQRALDEYTASIPQKKHEAHNFVTICRSIAQDNPASVAPKLIHEAIKNVEEKNAKKMESRWLTQLLGPVVRVLKDFDKLIHDLVSATAPSTILWAAFSCAIAAADRYFTVFETIKTHLAALSTELQRMSLRAGLYNSSQNMRDLLCQFYISVIRFWYQVERECTRSFTGNLLRKALPSSMDKLNGIIDEIKQTVSDVEKMAVIVEARLSRGDREDSAAERKAAGMERNEAQKERDEAVKFREEQRRRQEEDKREKICSWFDTNSRKANQANVARHERNLSNRLSDTCEWLIENPTYVSWRSAATKPAILWLHGPPGSGKSILCSSAIEDITRHHPHATLVYHFYEFDHNHTAAETLQILADKLFDAYWVRHRAVPDEFFLKMQQRTYSLENMKELIVMLIRSSKLEKVIFMMDGLDEEAGVSMRWTDACTVLSFLITLAADYPDSVKLWCSSQDQQCIHKLLEQYTVIQIRESIQDDVARYLERAVPHLPEDKKEELLGKALKRVDGNFLCASLMVRALREEASSLAEVEEFIESGRLPGSYDVYYARVFQRIDKPMKALACKVFALIAFARRPLRIKELAEAVGILQSKDQRRLLSSDLPFREKLEELFAPLIEVRLSSQLSADWHESTCHLFHSTVRKFLDKYPKVLDGELVDVWIDPYVMADACLRYLSQARYSRLLHKDESGMWLDGEEEPVDHHQFFVYCAKYWDKHLDDVRPSQVADGKTTIHNRVKTFLRSPNFQTTLQAQSLWVDSQFDILAVDHSHGAQFIRRMFPRWFVERDEGGTMWLCYRQFLYEWRDLLRSHGRSVGYLCDGEVDRCWWAALGKHNFLSMMPSRYTSFRFQSNSQSTDLDVGWRYLCEGVGQAGDELKILRLSSRERKRLVFACEHWIVPFGSTSILQKTQHIHTDEDTTLWSLYTQAFASEDSKILSVGKVSAAAFLCDCRVLRIGAQVFTLNKAKKEYVPIPRFSAVDQPTRYFEECAVRGKFVVVATRRKATTRKAYESGFGNRKIERFGAELMRTEEMCLLERERNEDKGVDGEEEEELSSDDSEEGSDDNISSDELPDSDSEAYESWSDCSSEYSVDEDDVANPWAGPPSDDEKSTHDSLKSETEAEVGKKDAGSVSRSGDESDSDSSSDESNDIPPLAIGGYGRIWDDDDDYRWVDDNDDDAEDGAGYCIPLPRREKRIVPEDTPMASISVFDTGARKRIFHFEQTLRFMLFDSPPVIHPTNSLVIWPLSGGTILFASFMTNSYFTRRLRPSTSYTRHIFMKCRFSPCGDYLHVASLEGQNKPISRPKKKTKKKTKTEPTNDESLPKRVPIKLALFISTYRLCTKRPARAPPSLIHRAKVALGSHERLSIAKLPFTLTWTPKELHLTCSDALLKVYRLRLFPSDPESSVLIPVKSIFLPDTARRREVRYFSGEIGRIIVGSETRESVVRCKKYPDAELFELKGTYEPPIGCFVREEEDLGGWGESKDEAPIPEDMGIGQFSRLLEKFDPDEDCDLEPYIF